MLDIDDFKKVNDTYGHLAGDAVLRAAGETLKNTRRRNGITARCGGEEFAVLIPNASPEQTAQVAEKLLENIAAMVVPDVPGVTVSSGCTACGPGGARKHFSAVRMKRFTRPNGPAKTECAFNECIFWQNAMILPACGIRRNDMFTVSVMVTVHSEYREQYREAALRHANNTFTREEGCLGFAVHAHESDPDRFFLYESYRSRKDFEEVHKVAPYLAEFVKLTAPWTKTKEIAIWDKISPDQ